MASSSPTLRCSRTSTCSVEGRGAFAKTSSSASSTPVRASRGFEEVRRGASVSARKAKFTDLTNASDMMTALPRGVSCVE